MFSRILIVGGIFERPDCDSLIFDARSHDEKGVVVATATSIWPIRVERVAGWRHLLVDRLVSG
jgi:hypothetical protein